MNKKFTKFTGLFLALMLMLSFCITAYAANTGDTGSKKNPIVITTAQELDAFAAAVNGGEDFAGKYIVLGNDITVSNGFSPIGSKDFPFSGNFDGNGKTLSGFNIECDYAGFFAYISGARINNLTVSGEFSAGTYAGAVAAYAKNSIIENCKCASGVYANKYAGGIVGYISSGKIIGCSSSSAAAVGGYEDSTGGIAGFSGAVISNCENNSYTFGVKNVGGIAGTATGDILYSANLVAVYSSASNLGGIAGLSEGNIKNCRNSGRIIPDSSDIGNTGGIVGVIRNGNIEECISSSAVAATGNFSGGIAGYVSDGNITNCLVTGSVSNTGSFAGGIFGFSLRSNITKCVTLSTVAAKDSTNGAVGGVSQGTVSDCYYINTITKATATGSASAAAVSESDFTSTAVLAALDFNDVWVINELHASYPLLKNVSYHTLINTSSKEATCEEDGFFKGECSVCKESVNTVIPATGHSYVVVSSKNPTCTSAGYEDVLCKTCDGTKTTDIPATGHTDADANNICDDCNTDLKTDASDTGEKSFFDKIADFFKAFIEWLKNLFN